LPYVLAHSRRKNGARDEKKMGAILKKLPSTNGGSLSLLDLEFVGRSRKMIDIKKIATVTNTIDQS